MACLRISGEIHDYINLNTFNNEHKSSESKYVSINPSGQIPTMVIGSQRILGSITSQLTYLCSANKNMGLKLLPQKF